MECNVALFCNEECMVRANKYHKYECPCLSVIMEDSIGTAHSQHISSIRICTVHEPHTFFIHYHNRVKQNAANT